MLSFCVSEYCNSVCECCHSVIFRRPCWQLYLTRDDFKDLEILIFFRFRRLLVGFHDVMWELSGHRCGHHRGTNPPQQIIENCVLLSGPEYIEWDYGNVGTMWALVDYEKVL